MGIDAEMFVRTREPVTEKQVKRWSFEVCALFGRGNFFVDPKAGRHALKIVDEYTQDGPTLTPETGETFIRVSLWSRYWGEGYERGDIAFILMLAAVLEEKIPGAEVWYGGDSSGVFAAPLDEARRRELIAYAASPRGLDYLLQKNPYKPEPDCERSFCEAPMSPSRWGNGATGFVCAGCGLHSLIATDGSRRDHPTMYPDEARDAN